MLLNGVFPPITTPFYPDGKVYYKKLEHNVDRYSRTLIAGMLVLGSTGETVMLSDQERRDVLNTVRDATAPQKVLIAGTGMPSAEETLRLTEYAAEVGYDIALVVTPHFYHPQMEPANMLAFYRTIADRSPIPVMLYSVPAYTRYDLPAEIAIELSDHPNIIGMKDSGGDAEKIGRIVKGTRHIKLSATVTETFDAFTPRMVKAATQGVVSEIQGQGGELVQVGAAANKPKPSSSGVSVIGGIKTRQKEVGFQVMVGVTQKLEASLQAGAGGGIAGLACAAPMACYEVYAAYKEGDFELAHLKQVRIAKAAERIVGGLGIAGVKYAMDFNGYYGGAVRLPLLPLTAELKAEVENLLADIRN